MADGGEKLHHDIPHFLSGGGETARLIAAYDWSTSLGPIDTWPESLKTTVGLLIHSPVPIVLLWGVDGIMIYNDAYSIFAGRRHPKLLGSKVREGWPEVADFNDNVMKVGLAGQTLSYSDQELTLHRAGKPEQVFMNLDYSPVIDESGWPGGVIAIVVETTQRVKAERNVVAERESLARMFHDAPSFMAQLDGPEHVFTLANKAYQQLIGHREVIGKPIREALPEIEGQGFFELLDELYASGESYRGDGRRIKLQHAPGAPPEDHLLDFVYQPVFDTNGQVTGIFVEGIDVTKARQAEARRDALARLTEALRDADDLAVVQFEAARILGETLGVSRVGYGSIDPETEILSVDRDWTAAGVETLAGTLPLRDYGSFVDSLKKGEFVSIADVAKDPRTAHAAEALRKRSAGAFINQPVIERGRLVAVLYINNAEIRDWSPEDLALIREIGARTRMSSERIRTATAIRENEARLRFLDRLAEQAAKSLDADAILATTTEMLGRHLNVSNCAYADMDDDQDGFTIRGDWSEPGSPSIVGHYSLADFGKLAVTKLGAGLPLIINDNLAELAPDEAATFQNIGISATICMPLVKEGRLTALMAIHDKVPRVWTSSELALLTEVTERSWAHIERVSAEAELRASEQQLRTLAQAMPNHVWTAQPSGYLDWFNDQIYAYSGLRTSELDGPNWAAMVHPDDLPEVMQRWTEAVEKGTDYETEFRLHRHDGTWRWHLARAVPLRDSDGTIVRWIGTNTDVDDQKNVEGLLEKRLEEKTAERDRIWRVSQDMLLVADSRGIWQSVNPAWTRVLGWSEKELVGRTSEWLEHPDDRQATRAELERLVAGMTTVSFINRIRARDGEYRTLSWSATPVEGILYCVARDITEQRQQEAALKEAEEHLRQAQKMEAVGHLTGGIAHDFNNLLAGISGSLELLEKRLATGRLSGVERYIQAAQGAARRAAALTQRLLAFSRRQTLDPKPVDVNRLVAGMEDLIRRSVGPLVEVEVVGAGDLWVTRVDPSQLENSLLNLCINGRDAMAPNGGRITIETANKWLEDRAARERDLMPGQYISLCVTDTGTGMTPEVIARAFDPFYTTKPLGEGTGLGLSMVYGFARQSGGQVRIYSEVGKGTTMCLYLPRFLGSAEADEASITAAVDKGDGETVLVIDDEPTIRMLVVEVLEENGYTAIQASDGPNGLRILQSDTRIDLLITDVGLPGGMNGRQVADAGRVTRPDLKVLFITGFAENAAIGNGHLGPGMEVITKPFMISTLANKIRDLIDR
ncbi:PAS domain S-box protein (plasmid) [Rhizobium leguminosarum]|uniref:PAS domain S-box protein n=1 Tax=Rhizobium leguminosarum TaxID=384 RepID=UPI00102F8CCE|nr:PAS domain S-box protein [Rhizobium leguminosarum]TAY06943.1 PAS domain S-box protein [Rhizobium leguminosarum]